MSETSVTEYAAGSLTGERVFRVNPEGWLTGVTFEMVWEPGVNEAVCCATGPLAPIAQVWTTHSWHASSFPLSHRRQEHRVSGVACCCGFYAYYDGGSNQYAGITTVAGIIEGTGITSIGTRGFRCQKAQIVALVRPRSPFSAVTNRFLPMWMLLSAVVQAAFGVGDFIAGNTDSAWISVTLALVFLVCAIVSGTGIAPAGKWRKIKKNYPDVPIYKSMKAAREAHPLTDKSDYAIQEGR